MLPFFLRYWLKQCACALARATFGSVRRHCARKQSLAVECLEDRVNPTNVSWDGGAGTLNWADGVNWSNDVVPTVTDDVTINVAVSGTINVGAGNFSVRSLNDSSAALAILSGGTLALSSAGANSFFRQNTTVNAGGTLAVGANANVTIGPGVGTSATVTLGVGGTVTFAAGAAVTLSATNYYGGTAIAVYSGGLLTATGAGFNAASANNTNGTNYTQITVGAGGRLQAANSSFGGSIGQLNFAVGATMSAGDLTGDAFDTPLYVPAIDVQYLTNNLRFGTVNIQSDTLVSGQSVALNAMGTQTTTNLRYVFPGNFAVNQGATLAFGPNVPVTIGPGVGTSATVTLGVGGTVTFAAGAAVTLSATNYYGGTAIAVYSGGLLTATGAGFNAASANNTNGTNYTQITVGAGGRLQATGSYFGIGQLNFAVGATMSAGDLTGDAFDSPLYVPAIDVQYLTNNLRFGTVNIQSDTLVSGQSVALNAMGTQTTANLRYVFPGNFTVNQGATLAFGPNVPVTIGPPVGNNATVALSVGGTVSFAAGDTVTLSATNYYGGTLIIVNSGGLVTATGTNFNAASGNGTNGGNYTQILVNSGGRLQATNSTFAVGALVLNTGTTATIQFSAFATQLSVNSGATITINQNDFTNGTVVSVGPYTDTINLQNNYWGTTNTATIDGKITDRNDSPVNTRPLVVYSGYQGAPAQAPGAITGVVFNDLNGNGIQDSGEAGQPGVVVFLDTNNNGIFDAGEATAVTQTDNPTTTPNEAGQFIFSNLIVGTYVVREVAPTGSTETAPSASAVTTTVLFDGAETGITGGATTFTYQNATFSGGTVSTTSAANLRASGGNVYNASVGAGNAAVDFSRPVSTATFFYVHATGTGPYTATAYAPDGTVLGTVSSKLATTNADPANFVTLGGFAQTIARITFTGGYVDNFAFTIPANNQAYVARVVTNQTTGGINFGNQVPSSTALVANGVSPTSTGFTATFNAPIDVTVLNLYDTSAGTFGAPDATLVGQTTGPVTGSLVVSPDHTTVTFIKTAGVLAPDTYTITLHSGTNAFKTALTGILLDGNADGAPGDDLVSTFTVSPLPSNGVVVSVPNFTRGFGQAVNVPASATTGLPITISTGQNVTGVDFTLHYDPTLLTISNVTTAISAAAVDYNIPTPGTLVVTISSATAFSSTPGAITLVNITATVPNTALYASKEILDITGLHVFDNSPLPVELPSVAQDGIHVASFFGDTNGSQSYSSADSTLLQRVIVGSNSGFIADKLADPVLISDLNLNGSLASADTTLLQRLVVGTPVSTVPALPVGVPNPGTGGPDPVIFIPQNLSGLVGSTVTVPVMLTVTEAAGITISGTDIALAYDSSRFTVSNVRLGSLLTGANVSDNSFSLSSLTSVPGFINLTASTDSNTHLYAHNTTGSLFLIDFTVRSGAASGASSINLLANSPVNNLQTDVNDNDALSMVLSPAPTNASNDSVDGTFTVGPVASATTVAAAAATATFGTSDQPVNLSATVTSSAGTVNEGTVTFTILNGSTVIGSAVTSAAVSAGAASASYTLPAGTGAGTYTIQAVYNGTSSFLTSTDSSHSLVVSAAATATASASASTTFNTGSQAVNLSATVTSSAGTVNGGTVTFTLLSGSTVIGTATTSSAVTNGSASVSYTLPAGTFAGTYTIQAVYNGTTNFTTSTDSGHALVIAPAASITTASAAAATFSAAGQTVNLSATIASAAGAVNGGAVTFTILSGTTVIGTATTSAAVANGSASVSYTLPAGTSAATYTIQAAYSGTANFTFSTDSTHALVIGSAATTASAGAAAATFSTADQTVDLSATVTSAAGTVNGGTITFTILSGTTVVGTATTSTAVASGSASVSYTLPTGTSGGTYTIRAEYSGTASFSASTDTGHTLVIAAASATATASAAAATFNTGVQTVDLTTSVTSAAGTVNEGTVTYSILSGATVIGNPVTVAVSAGAAATAYALPAGTPGGTYTLKAVYSGTTNFLGDTDTSHTLVIAAASATASASAAAATFSTGGQTVNLTSTVTSGAGTVNEGTVTFTILQGTTIIGGPVTINVSAGAAATAYAIPAGTPGGTYIIQVVYNGTTNFLGYTDSSQTLVIAAASATATASAAATSFSTGAQTVNLSSTITSPAGTVNEGDATFTILSGTTIIGGPVTVNVSAGAAATAYTLPAGTGAGTYIIQVVYNGTTNFLPYTDTSHSLVLAAASATARAAAAAATFSPGDQTVNLTSTVTSPAGTVNEGTVTYTILSGTTVIGGPVTVNVTAGAAAAAYALPAGTAGGTYTIQAVYSGTTNILGYTDTSHTLVIAAASATAAASAAAATYSTGGQTVNLTSTVTSPVGTVNEGTVTYTILDGTTIIGGPVTVNVSASAAAAAYALPAGTPGGTYTLKAVYSGTTNFLGDTDTSHTLVIAAASATASASAAAATFSTGGQTVNLTSTVTSGAGTVNEGTVTFTVLSGTTVIGTPVTVNVSAGAAATAYALPAGTPVGTYTIRAAYSGTANFLPYTDAGHTLAIAAASATATASAAATGFSTGAQSVNLTTTITSPAGTVNEGNATFTILKGTTVIGSPVTVSVSAGAAATAYALPAGTGAGTYVIRVEYNGATNFLPDTDASHNLVIAVASATASASATAATFSVADQTVNLSATVTSPAGTVNEGTATFALLSGATVIGTPVTVNVSAGAAAAAYVFPAGIGTGTYTIRVVFNGTANFLPNTDATQVLTVGAAAGATAAAAAAATFSTGSQSVPLTATITSAAGVVSEGTETFTILNGTTVIGSPVTVNVSAGAASAAYALPAGTPGDTYIIKAVYNGTSNFLPFTDTSHALVVAAASASASASAAAATFSTSGQTVNLNATITSGAGTVNEGSVTFTILNGTAPIGSPVTVSVSAGAAAAAYPLPAGTPAGTYTIQAVYGGTNNFTPSTDTSHALVVSAVAAATAAASAAATFSTGGQTVNLSATVTSPGGTVNEGTETFTILSGTTVIGSPVTVNVSAGAAAAAYALPAGTPGDTYTIRAVYSGTTNFLSDTDTSHNLVVNAAASAAAAASASATFSPGALSVPLTATVTSSAGPVNGGTVTFTLLSGTTVIGSPVASAAVSAGSAGVAYNLPAGTPPGAYTIRAVYSGTPNFLPSTDATHALTIGASATATAAASATATFSESVQSVPLSATVTSPAGTVNEGTVTFTILNGTTPVGNPVTVGVSAGAAAASYALPAGTPAGPYTIQAAYNATPDFGGSTDATRALTVSAAATATAAASASATFSESGQMVNLSATVTSPAGPVNGGAVTFTVLSGTTPIGSPVTSAAVAAGAASVAFALPAGAPAGPYTIRAEYAPGNSSFSPSSGTGALNIDQAGTTTSASVSNGPIAYSSAAQPLTLTASVTSPAGPVNGGTVTFTILSGSTVIGSPVTSAVVSAGVASVVYALPAGTPTGPYTIQAAYTPGSGNFSPSTGTGALSINPAGTTTAGAAASLPFSTAAQPVTLTATVSSPAGSVNGGTVTFTVLNGTTPVGSPVTVPISAGVAAANYSLPAGTPAGPYTIRAAYNGTPDFLPSADNTGPLTVTAPAVVSAVAVDWGIETAALQFAPDGIRLLSAGRNKDLPWYNINRIAVTLSQAEVVNPGDVTVAGMSGGSYGPVTVSGSGTTHLLVTLAKGITASDRVTLTIGNSQVTTYTGRIDVLPGDVNDDGYVNVTDGSILLANPTPAHAYQLNNDFNGDGAVNTTDFTQYRPFIGTTLPALPPQLAAGGEGPGAAARLTPDALAPVLAAAIDAWAAAGLPAQDVTRLRGVTAQITNLPAGYLGTTAIGGDVLFLSADAAGYGWFVDPAPRTRATPSAAAVGHEDLLTVVTHELGHTLGLDDHDTAEFSDDLMALTLATGAQRLPSTQDVAAVLAEQPAVSHALESAPPASLASSTEAHQTERLIGNANSDSPLQLRGAAVVSRVLSREPSPVFLAPLPPEGAGVDSLSPERVSPHEPDASPFDVPSRPADKDAALNHRPAGDAMRQASDIDFGSRRDVQKDDFSDPDV